MTLDDQLLQAHAEDDRRALVGLYEEAADQASELDAECFYLTHAYIFALDVGDRRSEKLATRLAAHGRI